MTKHERAERIEASIDALKQAKTQLTSALGANATGDKKRLWFAVEEATAYLRNIVTVLDSLDTDD